MVYSRLTGLDGRDSVTRPDVSQRTKPANQRGKPSGRVGPLGFLFFAVPIFYSLLDQLPLPYEGLRPAVVLSFFAFCSLPLWGHLLPPRPLPFAYPTYKPL